MLLQSSISSFGGKYSPIESKSIIQLLDRLGLSVGSQGVEIKDLKRAEACYIHHAHGPVALVGYALVSQAFAKGRLPNYTFLHLISKRPAMDECDASALAALCGVNVAGPFWGNPAPFGAHLVEVIERYELGGFFDRLDPRHAYGRGSEQYLIRPRGADWHLADDENEAILKSWRSDYRKLPDARKLLVATIVRLYNDNESSWLVRVPKNWHAADGVATLREAGALADWARLVALYPGW